MSSFKIKIMNENAIVHMKKNISTIANKIQENDTNEWIYNEFPQPMFIEKKYEIEDFELQNNINSLDKKVDLSNSIVIYEHLRNLPRYILTSENFWLWLHFEKFYDVTKSMMRINGVSTITDHWMHKQGTRRGLMFGVLSRCFFRVSLTVDDSSDDIYELTKWVVANPLRFRNLTWRSFSSEKHIVRGTLKGEKRAVDEWGGKENNDYYARIAKDISEEGSIKLLDAISEKEIEDFVYEKMISYSQL